MSWIEDETGIDFSDPVSIGTFGLTSVGEITGADEAAEAAAEGARLSAEATLESTEKNIEFQKWLWGEQKGLTQPWVTAGAGALSRYQTEIDKPFEFEKDPGYEFRKAEGLKGIESSAAARGMQLSGRTLKNVGRFSQDFASSEFDRAYARRQDYLGRLQGLSQMGLGGATGQAQTGGVMGGRVSQSIMTGGQAQANMYSQLGDIRSAQAMAPWNTLMQIGGLSATAYGAS